MPLDGGLAFWPMGGFIDRLKFAGNHAVVNALTAAWISIGNIWMFGGLLLTMRLAQREKREKNRH